MNWDATSQIEAGGNHPQPGQFHSQAACSYEYQGSALKPGSELFTEATVN
jgi:hypothetical protein